MHHLWQHAYSTLLFGWRSIRGHVEHVRYFGSVMCISSATLHKPLVTCHGSQILERIGAVQLQQCVLLGVYGLLSCEAIGLSP